MHRHEHVSRVTGKALLLTLLPLSVQLVFWLATGSLSVLSDTLHGLGHAFSLSLVLLAQKIALQSHNREESFEHEYHLIEVGVSAANGVLLFVFCSYLLTEALGRLDNPPAISASIVFAGVVSLFFNLAVLRTLHTEREHFNIRVEVAHAVSDAGSSLGVILAGVLIHFTGEAIFDPVVSIGIASVILLWSLVLIFRAGLHYLRTRRKTIKHTL